MPLWIVQRYEKVPAVPKVREKVPLDWVAECVPSPKVTLCPIAPFQVQVTVVPTATVVAAGEKKLSPTEMALLVLPLFPPLFPPGPVGASLELPPQAKAAINAAAPIRCLNTRILTAPVV
jgi:hypothetical protein